MSITVVTPPAAAAAVRARIPSAVVLPEWTWQSIAPGNRQAAPTSISLAAEPEAGSPSRTSTMRPPATRISPRTGSPGPLTTRPAIESSTAGISGPADDIDAPGEAELR
jgi:hypothetical protein